MQINVNLTSEPERLLEARYKREGLDLNADLTSWVMNQIAKEQRNLDITGATLEQVEAVATSREAKRAEALAAKEKEPAKDK